MRQKSVQIEDYLPQKAKAKQGEFWITWKDAVRNFQTLYLNWNPDFYTYKIVLTSVYHSKDPSKKFYDEDFCVEYNP